jgi:uncharacterized protein
MSTAAGQHPESATLPASDRVRLRRIPERGRHDRGTIDAIIDASMVGTVAFSYEGQPYAIPTNIWRERNRLYWHASRGSRMVRATAGAPVCVSVFLVDELVLGRSAMHHAVNYRSVVVLGTGHLVTDAAEVEASLKEFIESFYPGRWSELRPMTDKERSQTAVMYVDLDEASAKIRDTGAGDEPGDETWPAWGGVIPVRQVLGEPRPDEYVPHGMPGPEPRAR